MYKNYNNRLMILLQSDTTENFTTVIKMLQQSANYITTVRHHQYFTTVMKPLQQSYLTTSSNSAEAGPKPG